MAIFFGTDGIRGVVNSDLTYELAFKFGNALGRYENTKKIVIGRDTRTSGSFLTNAFALGAMSSGVEVIDIGICTTPGVAFLTKFINADFGVVISASHNPPEYNGIKILTKEGFKLGDEKENELERKFVNSKTVNYESLGKYYQKFKYIKHYINKLKKSIRCDLKGLKIVIDGSNGASFFIAPKVFKSLGAEVFTINCKNDGKNINKDCGSLHPEGLKCAVLKYNADVGFAFDGDADRIIACDNRGEILDGDGIIYILAKFLKTKNELKYNTVVGTRHTNMAIEKALKSSDINLIRSDIGDKYVIEKIEQNSLSLGGEKSGHIILRDFSTTGDGVLTALKLTEILKETKKSLKELFDVELYPQVNLDVVVKDKIKIINSEKLSKIVDEQEKFLGEDSRIMVRVSGTEPKIRVMVETKDYKLAKISARKIENAIKCINEGDICVE